jgi:predicted Rossmann-fold nucleotide-binding protein
MLTWLQLGIHKKPCAILNVANFYLKFIEFISYVEDENFIHSDHNSMLIMDSDPGVLISKMENFNPVIKDKANWIIDINNY